MIRNLNYKKKCYLLFAGFLTFLIMGFNFSFSDTFLLAETTDEKENRIFLMKDKEGDLPALKSQMEEFNRTCSINDSSSVRDKLTTYISDFAEKNNCIVTEIPLTSTGSSNNLKVQTNVFTMKGSFNELVSLLYKLETDYKYLSKTMSAHFFTQRDAQTKKKNLYLTIYSQYFSKY